MRGLFEVLFGNQKAVRDFAMATVAMGLVAFIGVTGIIKAVEWAETRNDQQARAAGGDARTFVVTRSVLDDDITTGSLSSAVADTRLDPCRLEPRRLTTRP